LFFYKWINPNKGYSSTSLLTPMWPQIHSCEVTEGMKIYSIEVTKWMTRYRQSNRLMRGIILLVMKMLVSMPLISAELCLWRSKEKALIVIKGDVNLMKIRGLLGKIVILVSGLKYNEPIWSIMSQQQVRWDNLSIQIIHVPGLD
jgi:hypothetical protein